MTIMQTVETIKVGEFVKRKEDATKIYRRGSYDSGCKRYSLDDTEDISRQIWVKKGTVLFVDFTY